MYILYYIVYIGYVMKHYAIVPKHIIDTGDGQKVLIWCELYLLEITKQTYSLLAISKKHNASYKMLRSLQSQIKTIINKE